MKHVLFAALLLAGLAGSLTPAFAQTTPRTLTMAGHGEARAVPDQVTLSAGVTTQASSAAQALTANSARMQAVFAALKKLGVADRDMQTANFSVAPQFTNADNQVARISGYQVNNQLEVTLDDVSKLGAALDALVSAGTNQLNGVTFSIHDPTPLLAQARQDAVAEARTKAETYAKAAGVTLGSILSVSENDNQGPRPMFMAAPMLRATKAVPVQAGEESVTAEVSLVWEIH